jgi:hypothetical protein
MRVSVGQNHCSYSSSFRLRRMPFKHVTMHRGPVDSTTTSVILFFTICPRLRNKSNRNSQEQSGLLSQTMLESVCYTSFVLAILKMFFTVLTRFFRLLAHWFLSDSST